MASDSSTVRVLAAEQEEEDAILYAPLEGTTRGFWIAVVVLVFILLLGVSVYYTQLVLGLGVTGLN